MATDPRTFLVKNCAAVQQKGISDSQQRKDFFNSLGKVGDIELLNNSALAGKVGQGLRTLAKTSNSIRTGNLSPTNSAVPQNGTEVLAATGISEGATNLANTFSPGAVNRAVAQADVIAEKVKSGDYNIEDIPGTFTDIQNLSSLIDGTFVGGEEDKRDLEICGASPWAMDLIAFAPKYKFLFIMEFEFTEEFAANDSRTAAFVVKNCTRPQINFEHEEVNMYNFWVRVPKRTSYEPMTMRFYDDNKNAAMTLYETYLKAVSPIANISFPQKMEDSPGAFEAQSMGYGAMGNADVNGSDGGFALGHPYASSFGPIGNTGTTKNVFKRVTMYQMYDYGKKMNTYRFFNPKVLQLELDDMDSADNGNGNEVTIQFAYDAVNITTGVQISDQTLKTKLKLLTSFGKYPYDPNFGGNAEAINATDDGKRPGDPDAGGGFFDGIANAGAAATDALSSGIDAATGLVSDAFTSVSNFAGSIFTTAAGTGDRNASKGSVEPDI